MPFYDFYSNNTDVTPIGHSLMRSAARLLLASVVELSPETRLVLEIGPGWGILADISESEYGLAYIGIDINEGILKRINQRMTICSKIPPIPLSSATSDAVLASHVLEHMDGLAMAQKMLREMVRVVKPGGIILIASPDALWQGRYFWDADYSHNYPTSARRLHQLFRDEGLVHITSKYVYNHFTGLPGTVLGGLIRLIPYRIWNAQPNSFLYSDRIYRLRLTFSRSIVIIGQRPKD